MDFHVPETFRHYLLHMGPSLILPMFLPILIELFNFIWKNLCESRKCVLKGPCGYFDL